MPAPKRSRKVVHPSSESAVGTTAVAGRPAGSAKGRRILLVDDDSEIVESMRTVLESRGYLILVARDGNQGLAMAEKESPDLVVPHDDGS